MMGVYLGDGHLEVRRFRPDSVKASYRLHIACDIKYPRLIDYSVDALQKLLPGVYVGEQVYSNCVRVRASSKALEFLFPKKFNDEVDLTDEQLFATQLYPKPFIEGLIHSDGCIHLTKDRGYLQYSLGNRSETVLNLFQDRLDELEIFSFQSRSGSNGSVWVKRQADTLRMQEFIRSKE